MLRNILKFKQNQFRLFTENPLICLSQLNLSTLSHNCNFKYKDNSTNSLNTARCHNLDYLNLILPKYYSDISQIKPAATPAVLEEFRAREERKEKEFNEADEKVQDEQERKKTEEEERLANVKNSILQAGMKFVPTEGWSKEAIARGAESIGYAGVAHGMFPKGAVELIEYFYKTSNDELVELLKKELAGKPKPDNIQEFIVKAIKLRLEMILPYINSWPKAIAIMTLPPNVQLTLANLLMLSDDICHFAGDRSADFNWYARRVGLASIYKSTEIFMLQDKSPNKQSTWDFLNRRVEEAIYLNMLFDHRDGPTHDLKNAVSAAFVTARNILGFDFRRSNR